MTSPGDAAGRWRSRVLVPNLVFVGVLMALVSSLGAPLIPTIARADHVSVSTAQWVLTATLLTGALATPVMGRLADGPRQRDVVICGLVAVCAGCVLAALADSFTLLVIGRALQGVGLGLMPVTMATARAHLKPAKAARAIATLSITTAIGAGLGYPLTGLIVEAFNIRAAYWFGAIVVAAALGVSLVVLPRQPAAPSPPFDLVGAGLLSCAVVGISTVLSDGGPWGWTSPLSLSISAASLIILGLWIPYELKVAYPLVYLRHVVHRSVLTADVSAFFICVAMYLYIPILVEFVQVPSSNGFGFGSSVVVSGLVLIPLSVATFLASRLLGPYRERFGTRSMIPFGSLLFAAAGIFFAAEHTALWQACISSGLAGIGMGFTFAAMPGFIVRAVPLGDTGSAMGLYQVIRTVGLSVGSAMSAAVLTAYTHHGHLYPLEGGFTTSLIVSAGLCLATAFISYALPGREAAHAQAASEVPMGAASK